MLLGGLWHGASWNFVIWGGLHGLALCAHKLFSKIRGVHIQTKPVGFLSVLLTYAYVCICWVFFRSSDFNKSLLILKRVFSWENGIVHMYSWSFVAIFIMLCAIIIAAIKNKRLSGDTRTPYQINAFYPVMDLSKVISLTIFFFVVGMILGLAHVGYNPFIYFQF
jgi:alginate O-acetyltransferase complex protein AlgI